MEYVKTGTANTEYTGRIETMIQAVKQNEQARREYRFMSGFEMDAREEGIQQGFADGSYRKALETAKILKQLGDSVQKIMQATGLTQEEVESIS